MMPSRYKSFKRLYQSTLVDIIYKLLNSSVRGEANILCLTSVMNVKLITIFERIFVNFVNL